MHYIGIDIGSTAAKAVIMDKNGIVDYFAVPTGWNGKDTSKVILQKIEALGVLSGKSNTVATGYGRVSVPFADKTVTEITCHGLGGSYLFCDNATIIDVGGQDTKVVTVKNGKVADFLMNDKCSAGTGKFIEVMSNRLGLTIEELCALAENGGEITINSMCTVFAESEVIGFIGKGEPRENIARGILDSVAAKVAGLCARHGITPPCFLTGGMCESDVFIGILSGKLGVQIKSCEMGRYAGAIGAALVARWEIARPT